PPRVRQCVGGLRHRVRRRRRRGLRDARGGRREDHLPRPRAPRGRARLEGGPPGPPAGGQRAAVRRLREGRDRLALCPHRSIGARTHLVAEVERLALPPFNAYLEGASPYTLSSGSVSGKSEITLERSELEVNNQVVLSRLGLNGEPGEDFVKRQLGIPLTLALALMKDYRGDIALGLPFGGNLSEPSFSMRTVVLQGIVQ